MSDYFDDDKRPKPKVPEGFESEQQFLQEMRECYDRGVEADDHNRIAMLEDIEFTYGDQWDPVVRAAREKRRKPVLQVNRLPAYVAQIVNNRLINETEIRVFPEREGTKEVAELRQGLLRAIFKSPESDFARDEAMKYQVVGGVGYFALTTEYASDEVFDQNVVFQPVVDPLSVVLDPLAVLPCGGDSEFGFLSDNLNRKVFKKRYPWASETDFDSASHARSNEWFSQDAIKVAAYWRMVKRGMKTVVLTVEGEHKVVQPDPSTGLSAQEAVQLLLQMNQIARRPNGEPYIKDVPNRGAEMYLCSGSNILEGPTFLPISSIPIFRVPGWELRNGDRVYRWGLVRFMKDPVRLHNYQRSLLAEQMVAAPRNKWLASQEAVSGREKDFENSHLSDNPLLIFNSEGGKPERIPAPPVDQALLTETQMTTQDLRDVSNIHEAALGMKSNEVSAKAINARQQMTDLGSFIYADRLRLAEERAAKVCNELIPIVFDATRIVTVIGAEDKVMQAVINDPTNPLTDISVGKYGLAVTTGPATITKRALAAEAMMTFVNAAPESSQLVMDLVAEAQDWPKATEFARRFKAAMPANLRDPEEMTPEEQQAAQAEAEFAQAAKQVELDKLKAEVREINATTAERLARARSLTMAGAKAVSDAAARAKDVDAKVDNQAFEQRMRTVEAAITIQKDESNDDSSD
jgi:hypothetical protein